MRFKEFIKSNIKDNGHFDIEQFKIDTLPFCKEFAKYLKRGQFLWHGSPTEANKSNCKFDFKLRSSPRDTSVSAHDALNAYFVEKFGHPFRNWMFVSNSRNTARIYGTQYILFPIGHVDWFFIDGIKDMTNAVDSLRWSVRDNLFHTDEKLSKEDIAKLMKATSEQLIFKLEHLQDGVKALHFNDGIDDFFKNTDEMMIKCEKFYLIQPESMSIIMKQIIPYLETL